MKIFLRDSQVISINKIDFECPISNVQYLSTIFDFECPISNVQNNQPICVKCYDVAKVLGKTVLGVIPLKYVKTVGLPCCHCHCFMHVYMES